MPSGSGRPRLPYLSSPVDAKMHKIFLCLAKETSRKVLIMAAVRGYITYGMVCNLLRMSSGTSSSVLGRLEAVGLIERVSRRRVTIQRTNTYGGMPRMRLGSYPEYRITDLGYLIVDVIRIVQRDLLDRMP